jgi:hypothetical protein
MNQQSTGYSDSRRYLLQLIMGMVGNPTRTNSNNFLLATAVPNTTNLRTGPNNEYFEEYTMEMYHQQEVALLRDREPGSFKYIDYVTGSPT